MKYLVLLTLLLLELSTIAQTQQDTLSVEGTLGIRGRYQTGNLDQLAVNPDVRLLLSNTKFDAELRGSYQYLEVGGFNIVNDFWGNAVYRYRPQKVLFPAATVTYGFAKSYLIDHSLMAGAGVGVNFFRKPKGKKFQAHAFAGYLDLAFTKGERYTLPTLGSLIKSSIPVSKHVHISWELQTYHPVEGALWGVNNLVLLQYQVLRHWFFNLSHSTIYNNTTSETIQKTNTLMLLGIQYHYYKK